MQTRKLVYGALLLAFLVTTAEECDPDTAQGRSQMAAIEKAESRSAYVQKNDIEFKLYDRRQRISDDPTTILWCTTAFSIPSSPLFTVPVIGKLASGNKRPFPTAFAVNPGYATERPGPDGMYGSSGEYRYGFTPGNTYVDFYNMQTFCTTEPMVWQREKTVIVMTPDEALLKAHEAARKALENNDTAAAFKVLQSAISAAGGQ